MAFRRALLLASYLARHLLTTKTDVLGFNSNNQHTYQLPSQTIIRKNYLSTDILECVTRTLATAIMPPVAHLALDHASARSLVAESSARITLRPSRWRHSTQMLRIMENGLVPTFATSVSSPI